jgi:predicted nucleotidyltransferase component of viral defense system
MDIFRKHEIFEIEVLDVLKRAKLLDGLVFGGGSMLRLCHELNRYSVDLDFWCLKKASHAASLSRLTQVLEKAYRISDAQIKHFTLLVELRSPRYPRKLKLEIRREKKAWDVQDRIAFSKYSTTQVILKTHTLEQTMTNKIEAFLDRGEMRDCFDLEFLLRRGIMLPPLDDRRVKVIERKLAGFKERDYKVKLGSILESGDRDYYIKNKFSLLREALVSQRNKA